jgi:hypothetical protein
MTNSSLRCYNFARALYSRLAGQLSFAAVIPPAVLRLGPFEVTGVPARLITCLPVSQHTGHVIRVDGKHQATVGAGLQNVRHDALLTLGYQHKQRRVRPGAHALHVSVGALPSSRITCTITNDNSRWIHEDLAGGKHPASRDQQRSSSWP